MKCDFVLIYLDMIDSETRETVLQTKFFSSGGTVCATLGIHYSHNDESETDILLAMDTSNGWVNLLGGMPLLHQIAAGPSHEISSPASSIALARAHTAHAFQHVFEHAHTKIGTTLDPRDRAALVQSALNILALEAGLSDETMTTLRHAVASGMARKEKQEMEKLASAYAAAAHAAAAAAESAAAVSAASAAATQSMPYPSTASVPYGGILQPRPVKPASSKRQQLTVAEAAEIYALRPRKNDRHDGRCRIHCRSAVA